MYKNELKWEYILKKLQENTMKINKLVFLE